MIEISQSDFFKEGEERYGEDRKQWVFQCPVCKVKTKVQEWLDNDAVGMIGFSCIGRTHEKPQKAMYDEKKRPTGCDYAGGGFFKLNPVHIAQEDGSICESFDFADRPLAAEEEI